MDRREFLKTGLLAGALVPTAAFAVDALFSKRGAYEQLSIAYRHIHLGLSEPFSVLHISDTHLCEAYPTEGEELRQWAASRNRTFGGCQEDALAASLAWAKENADYVLHTGDLIDFQSQANLDCVRKYYDGTGLVGTTGNHDYQRLPSVRGVRKTADYNAESRSVLDAAFGFDTLFSAQVLRGVNFVCLDNSYGTVTADQVARFEAEVKKGLPIVLCMHVPFYTPAIARATEKYWHKGRKFRSAAVPAPSGDWARERADAVTDGFIRRLQVEPLLKGILAGHEHFDLEDRFSPTAMQYIVGGNFLYHGAEILFT